MHMMRFEKVFELEEAVSAHPNVKVVDESVLFRKLQDVSAVEY